MATNNQPTNQADNNRTYYSLRVSRPHTRSGALWDIFSKYSKNFCYCAHPADEEVPREHFHAVFLDMTDNKVEAMRKALKTHFNASGNEFFGGKWRYNDVVEALTYMKHVPDPVYRHRGSDWGKMIDDAPEWVHQKKEEKEKEPEKKKQKLADPVLSHFNILKQARLHAAAHNIKSSDLGVVLEHMTRTTNWTPDVKIMRQGLDPMHHKLYKYRAEGCVGKTPDWWSVRGESINYEFN